MLGLSDVYEAARDVTATAVAVRGSSNLGQQPQQHAGPDGGEGKKWKPPDQFRRCVGGVINSVCVCMGATLPLC